MKKLEIIEKIKAIISDWGGVSSYELELEGSIVYGKMGKKVYSLIEYFASDKVEINTYVHEIETESYWLAYEDLNKSLLKVILNVLSKYASKQVEN